jgi:cell division protein FtsI (penicillin-binding protein 3)
MVSHIVGYTNVDGKGLSGMERSYESFLAEGQSNLVLTLDIRMQHILARELNAAIEKFSAKGGAGVIMNVNNGEILAAVSMPAFDPHSPGGPDNPSAFNKLTYGVYELGSVFKIFSTAALLETQNVAMEQKFDASKPLKRGGFAISDYHAKERDLTLPEVFMFSSNIGSALIGEMAGTEAIKSFYRDIGLFDPLSLEIGEVGSPLVPHPWREINTLTASYGHGIAVSPLHVASAVASIVNGGVLVQPSLVLDKNKAETSRKSPSVRIVSPQTSYRMRQLMRLSVSVGTGTSADVRGYRVGGKTGTAEKIGAGGYDSKRLISSFVGAFPMDLPQYAIYVVVDEPIGTKESFGYATGGWVAAPAVGKIIASMAPIAGVEPEDLDSKDEIDFPLRAYVDLEGKDGGAVASH